MCNTYIQKCCRERLAADVPWEFGNGLRVSEGEELPWFRKGALQPGGHGIPHWNLKSLVSYTWLVQTWLENPLPIFSMIFPNKPICTGFSQQFSRFFTKKSRSSRHRFRQGAIACSRVGLQAKDGVSGGNGCGKQYRMVPPSDVCWFINPMNTIVISAINNSYGSYLHQLS